MFTILALECSPSVRIGICQFKYDLASILRLINAPAKRADVTCSPEDKEHQVLFIKTIKYSLISSIIR